MKILNKIAAILLAVIFLLSGLGITITSMVCMKSGKGKASFAMIEDCCAKKKEVSPRAQTDCCNDDEEIFYSEPITIIKKGECCDINSLSFQLNDFQSAKKLSIDHPAVFNSLFHSSETLNSSTSENKLSFQYSDLPPPLYGRTLLNYISLLTI